MENLFIEKTKKTPQIKCDYNDGIIEFKGISIPNVATPLYEPVVEWIKEYATNPKAITKIIFDLKHFDSDTSKCYFDILKLVQDSISRKGYKVIVDWYCRDEDMKELGDDYSSLLDFQVNIIV